VTALAGSLLKRNLRITAFLVLAAIGRVLAMFLKERLDSPRPSAAQVILGEHFDGFGFPSGHATTAAVVMGTLAFLTATFVHPPRWRWVMFGVAIIGVAITCFARIHAGAHWFTDTIGGALIGTTIVLVAANLSAVFATRQQPAASQPEPAQIQAR
jgi:undecaprenyl-diphosphatase